MVLKRIEERTYRKTRTRIVLMCDCDVCGQEFELTPGRIKRITFHTCSTKCQGDAQRRGGILDELKRQRYNERYGVDNPAQSSEVSKKREATNLVRYGHVNPFSCDSVKQKIRQTTFERYGAENIVATEHYRKSVEKTAIERYGSVKAFNQNMLEKRTRTNLERYGVENPLQRPDVLAKQMATMQAKGAKRFSSKLEKHVESMLRQAFDEVHTQKWINGRPIDFYLPSLDLYVQVDGEFYHGLSERSLKYDFVKANYDSDRVQDAWFAANGLKLLRLDETTCRRVNVQELAQIVNAFSGR